MKTVVKFIGAFFSLLALVADCNGQILELFQYHRMPKLAETDDYDQCMQEVEPGEVAIFCMTRAVIKPDNSSDLWNFIADFSRDRRYHNHALLDRGICLNECQKLVQRLPNPTREALKVAKFPINFTYIHDTTLLKNSVKDQMTYGELVDICINYKLNESYGLRAYTEIEACDKSNQPQDVDLLDIFFLAVLVVLILLVILSSCCDQSYNSKQDVNHYKRDLDTRKKILFVSFSILRNWYRLTSRSQDPLDKDLRIFQAIRFGAMCLVIFGHVYATFIYLAMQNPSRLEMANHSIFMMLIGDGNRFVQSFFAMGAFLLVVMVLKHAQNLTRSLGISFVLKATVYRYIRLTPVYAFLVLLHATWLTKLQDGPWWKIRGETERALCRRNWWTNLLYINNYNNVGEHCMIHTWYMGCDFQLSILGNLLLLAIIRFKKYVAHILTVAVVVLFLITAFFVYYDKLDGGFVATLQSERFFFLYDPLFKNAYTSLQMNLGNYLIGIIAAVIYLHLRKKKADVGKKTWFRIVWFMMFPLGFGTMLLNSIFFIYDFEKPSLWMAAFHPLSRNIWGVYTCLFFIGLIFGVQPATQRIFSHPIFQPLGRLTYSAYLAHLFIVKVTLYSIRSPMHLSLTKLTTSLISSVVLSYLMALGLCLILELPITASQKLIFPIMKAKPKNSLEEQNGHELQ